MRVHIQSKPEPEALAVLEASIDAAIELSFGAAIPANPSYTILVAGRPEPELLKASAVLNAVLIPFAGLPKVTAELMRGFPGIQVHNLHHNAPATAELAVALLMAAAKSIVPIDSRFRLGDWSDRGQMDRAVQLAGRGALVLGYGAIGQRVARACQALGMTVRAVARRKHAGVAHEIHTPDALPTLLPQAHALIVCLPATPETEGMFGAIELGLLPRDAVVVNIGRGAIIDERALFDALKKRRIFAAGLDVWWRYPPGAAELQGTSPSVLPFHELDNVVLSPHRGGHVSDTEPQRMHALAESLNAAQRGEQIPNRVDLNAGY